MMRKLMALILMLALLITTIQAASLRSKREAASGPGLGYFRGGLGYFRGPGLGYFRGGLGY